MTGLFIGIYLVLGLTVMGICEFAFNIFDHVIDDGEADLDDNEKLGDIGRMFVKGFLQFTYVALWWVVILITIIYVVNGLRS